MTDEGPQVWFRSQATRILLSTSTLLGITIYFGLIYTITLYSEFGIAESQLGYGTTDYVFLGLNSVLRLVGLQAAVISVALLATHFLLVLVGQLSERWLVRLLAAATVVGLVVAALSWPDLSQIGDSSEASRWWLAMIIALYAIVRLVRVDPVRRLVLSARIDPERLADAIRGISIALSVVALFALMQLIANDEGFRQACWIEANPERLPKVTLFAAEPIGISARIPADTDESASGWRAAPRATDGTTFVYEGYRLLVNAPEGLLIWPADTSPRDGMIVVGTDRLVAMATHRERPLPPERVQPIPGQDPRCVQALFGE